MTPSTTTTWPAKGYDGPQPWELDALGVEQRELGPGEPDDFSPVVFSQQRPILVSGSAGADVADLCRMLAELGYPTSLTRGENPFLMLGPDELAAVRAFRRDFGIREDPSAFLEGEADAERHVGPVTWEALVRAVAGDTVDLADVGASAVADGAEAQARDDRIYELQERTEASLIRLTRPILNERAKDRGVEDPEKLDNKDAVVAAIVKVDGLSNEETDKLERLLRERDAAA